MSFKPKDLHFDSSQPAFLRRLRGELTGENSARHERSIPRNRRMKEDDEDDAPTYVLEETNQSLSKEEYDAFVSGKDAKDDDETITKELEPDECAENSFESKDKTIEVRVNAKKRKAAKIINGEQRGDGERANPTEAKVPKRQKKKAKAVKLTFGNEEEH